MGAYSTFEVFPRYLLDEGALKMLGVYLNFYVISIDSLNKLITFISLFVFRSAQNKCFILNQRAIWIVSHLKFTKKLQKGVSFVATSASMKETNVNYKKNIQ